MKKEILVKALRGAHYVGEIIVLADMVIHVCKFTKEHIMPGSNETRKKKPTCQ